MSESYEDLSRRATKGDEKALRTLFESAQAALDNERYEQAARQFKDAAISYRIAASRARTSADDTATKANLNFYRKSVAEVPSFSPKQSMPERASIVQGICAHLIKGDDLDARWSVRYDRYVNPHFVRELCARYLDLVDLKEAKGEP